MAEKSPVPGHKDPSPSPSRTPGSTGPGHPNQGGHPGEVPKKPA